MNANIKKERNTFTGMFGFLYKRKFSYFFIVIIASITYSLHSLVFALIARNMADFIIDKDLDKLLNYVLYFAVFLALWIPALMLTTYLRRVVTVKVAADFRENLFSHLQRLPMSYHENRHSGDLVSVITNDVSAVQGMFEGRIPGLIFVAITGLAAAAYMIVLSRALAFIVIFAGILPIGVNYLFAKSLRNAGTRIQASLAKLSSSMSDMLSGFQVVRTYNLKKWIMNRFGKSNNNLLKDSLHRVHLNSGLSSANTMASNLNSFLPMAAGTFLMMSGMISFGVYIALLLLSGPVRSLFGSLGGIISGIQGSLAAADRVLDVIEAQPEPESYRSIDYIPAIKNDPKMFIEYKNVEFSYGDKNVLQDLSFGIYEGKTAALVGASGGGKSTVFKTLLGCYPVMRGDIFVKEKPVNAYKLNELRDQFAYIPQDAFLYSGTVLENIRYGRFDATDDEVIEAAKSAYAHDFISKFPEGYRTKAGERGARLSGGERQRIAIARALLKNAPILLLDEATSALDSESEELVQRALSVLMKDRTTLIIAHRLSTIEHADIIFAIDNGKVAESGTHQELLAKDGLYSRLYRMQFRDESKIRQL